jgi:mono/diheme cytochrome c family protein
VRMFPPRRSSMLLLGLFLLPAILLWATQKQDQTTSPMRNPLEGPEIFRHYCASCHGVDGRGHGPASVALKYGAPDLTQIAHRNGGMFPFRRVEEIIEGKEPGPLAHGSREMPVWGPVFHEVESDMDLGEVRLDAVTKTIEAMQQK